jgi:hypothetical protein
MMRYFESFALGILIALTALIVQVSVSIFTEVLFRYDLTLETSIAMGFGGVVLFFAINALVEEIIRFSLIKKRVCSYVKNRMYPMLAHGALIGVGFWTSEVVLASFKDQSFFDLLLPTCTVLLIHTTLSIFMLFLLKKYQMIPCVAIIFTTAIIHTMCNMLLFVYTM